MFECVYLSMAVNWISQKLQHDVITAAKSTTHSACDCSANADCQAITPTLLSLSHSHAHKHTPLVGVRPNYSIAEDWSIDQISALIVSLSMEHLVRNHDKLKPIQANTT